MNRALRYFLFTLIVMSLLSPANSNAQYNNHLILRKDYKNIHHYLTGDSIRLMQKDYPVPIMGQIEAIGDNFIIIKAKLIKISDINTIYYRRPFHFRAAGATLQIAGPAFLAMSGVNALIKSTRPIWTVNNLITSGSLTTAGLILPKFQIKKYKLGSHFNLRIVPTDPVTYKKMHD